LQKNDDGSTRDSAGEGGTYRNIFGAMIGAHHITSRVSGIPPIPNTQFQFR